MEAESEKLKQFAQQLVSDQAVQIELQKRLSSAMLEFAQNSGVSSTAEELSQAIAEAAKAVPSDAADGGSWYKDIWIAKEWYISPPDLAANPPVGQLVDFMAGLMGGTGADKASVALMFANPVNIVMIGVVNSCRDKGEGVQITAPIALPAFAGCKS